MASRTNTPATTPAVAGGDFGSDAEQLDGLNLIDKAKLIGLPFIVTGVKIETNDRYKIAYVEVQTRNGEELMFSDTSTTGVRSQLAAKLNPPEGEWTDCRLFIPEGLRASTYDVRDNDTGRRKQATTYYLTTSGRRA